ncbi:hypothetical protein, partial [Solemya velum gill symbiont]|uniref:hypothetical protein n=1 Tax=Solemya velum gill symbiont TaxID=2340 RepID=UPI001C4DDC79
MDSDSSNSSSLSSSDDEYTTVSTKKRKKSTQSSVGVKRQNKSIFNNRVMKVSAINPSIKLANKNPVTISIAINVALGPQPV